MLWESEPEGPASVLLRAAQPQWAKHTPLQEYSSSVRFGVQVGPKTLLAGWSRITE